MARNPNCRACGKLLEEGKARFCNYDCRKRYEDLLDSVISGRAVRRTVKNRDWYRKRRNIPAERWRK